MHNRTLIFVLIVMLAACAKAPEPSAPTIAQATVAKPVGDPVEGLRIATRVGCNGCHLKTGEGKVFVEEPGKFRLVAANLPYAVRRPPKRQMPAPLPAKCQSARS